MTSYVQHRRSNDPAASAPALTPGELYINTAQRQLSAGSVGTGDPKSLIPVRYFDTESDYGAGDFVFDGGLLWSTDAPQLAGGDTPSATYASDPATSPWQPQTGSTAQFVTKNPLAGISQVIQSADPADRALTLRQAADATTDPFHIQDAGGVPVFQVAPDGSVVVGQNAVTGLHSITTSLVAFDYTGRGRVTACYASDQFTLAVDIDNGCGGVTIQERGGQTPGKDLLRTVLSGVVRSRIQADGSLVGVGANQMVGTLPSQIPLTISGAAGQTAHLLRLNAGTTTKLSVGANGDIETTGQVTSVSYIRSLTANGNTTKSDANRYVINSTTNNITVTIDNAQHPTYTALHFLRWSTGEVNFAVSAGATLVHAATRQAAIGERYSVVTAYKINGTTWVLYGGLKSV